MTMQHNIHPDDERLAALAGGDPDVGSDAELRAHLSTCETCRATVDELTMLRSALAELPDLVPSRRLQLLPPVAEPRAAGRGGWLRRLSAPIMAAGLGLVLVGAVGSSGVLNLAGASSGGAIFAPVGTSTQDALEGAGGVPSNESPREPTMRGSFGTVDGPSGQLSDQPSASASRNTGAESGASPTARSQASMTAGAPTAPPIDSGSDRSAAGRTQPTTPWLALLLVGVAFLVTGGVLRFALRPS
jgi:hypothetical protein